MGLRLSDPRTHAISQNFVWRRKYFLHHDGLADPDPKFIRRAFLVKRNLGLLAFVSLVHKVSDAPDDVVMVERWAKFVIGPRGLDIVPHICAEILRAHLVVHFYDKDRSTDSEQQN